MRQGWLALVAAVGLVTGLHAQNTPARPAPATPAPAPTRVAVINIQLAIASTDEGKQAAAELEARFAPRRTELENLNKQIQDLQERLQNGERTLSDQEKARLQREGARLSRTLQRKQEELSEDYQDARDEVVNRIANKMMQVIDRYARQNGYGIVLDTSAQTTSVLYAANTVDITQDIIKLYNQTYPVKQASSATPPKPKS